MDNNVNYHSLVNHARLGNKESMERLAEVARDRLFAYIYRLTLNYDLAEDLLQETLLEMVKSIKELEHSDRFWFWLFRTALGKVQHYFRDKKRKKMLQMSSIEQKILSKHISTEYDDGLDNMIRKELSDAIFEAMKGLKLKHRNVLVLRCFEQMPYSEIAVFMDCNELRARVMFFRAKNSLKKRLSRHGFSKAYFLIALGLFGLITAPAKAASAAGTVTASSLDVGLAAALIGTFGTKLCVGLAAALAAITFTLPLKTVLCILVVACFTLFFLFLVYLTALYK